MAYVIAESLLKYGKKYFKNTFLVITLAILFIIGILTARNKNIHIYLLNSFYTVYIFNFLLWQALKSKEKQFITKWLLGSILF